jgi:hypothetical protein
MKYQELRANRRYFINTVVFSIFSVILPPKRWLMVIKTGMVDLEVLIRKSTGENYYTYY